MNMESADFDLVEKNWQEKVFHSPSRTAQQRLNPITTRVLSIDQLYQIIFIHRLNGSYPQPVAATVHYH